MKHRALHLVSFLVAGIVILSACKSTVPSKYLQPDEMEDLMYDYFVSRGIVDTKHGMSDYQNRYNIEAVLRKHGLTQAEFDSSLVYYYNNMEQMNVIFTNIQKRLSEEALQLGASAGEVERFTIQSTSGDTTDVWEGHRQMLLMPIPPYHVVQFSQKADTSFHAGDSFLLTFSSHYLAQSGSRNANVGLYVTYENDSTASATTVINSTGSTTLRLVSCSLKVKKIDGFFYMARRDKSDNENDMCLLFLNRIQLMRFHKQKEKDEDLSEEKNTEMKTEERVEEKAVVMPADSTTFQKKINKELKPTITRQ